MRDETTMVALPGDEQTELVPDLSVLTEQPPTEPGKTETKAKAESQEVTETTRASAGLAVALVVIAVVAAVLVAMALVEPMLALLLGAGLILAAVLIAVGWWAWRRYARRNGKTDRRGGEGGRGGRTTGGGRGAGGGTGRGAGGAGGGKGGGLWPFGRKPAGGGKNAPAGGPKAKTPGDTSKKAPGDTSKKTPGDTSKKPSAGDKQGRRSWWPFGRNKPTGGSDAAGGAKTRPTGPKDKPAGAAKAPGGDAPGAKTAKTGRWPFRRTPKTPGGGPSGGGASGGGPGGGPGGGGPSGGPKPKKTKKTKKNRADKTAGDKTAGDSTERTPGDRALRGGRVAANAGAAALLGLASLWRAARGKPKTGGKAGPTATPVTPEPGGHRPETVIDVDPEDIISPAATAGPGPRPTNTAPGGPAPAAGPTATPRPTPAPNPAPGPAATPQPGRAIPRPLRTGAQQHNPVSPIPVGGPMSTTTDVDQDAIRVANRYAGLIQKAETLGARAQACDDAAQQYRRDARDNEESAENHKQSARTISDRDIAHQHAVAARDAEAEAAREVLAARFYEEQAENYRAQARSISF